MNPNAGIAISALFAQTFAVQLCLVAFAFGKLSQSNDNLRKDVNDIGAKLENHLQEERNALREARR